MRLGDTQVLLDDDDILEDSANQRILTHGAIRQLGVIVAFVFLLSFFFVIYTRVEFSRPRYVHRQTPAKWDTLQKVKLKEGFLVYSENCQIPDVDPYHPTVRELVQEKHTINCSSSYPAVTWTKGNALYIRPELIPRPKSRAALKCCYSDFTRSANSDDKITVNKNCKEITHGTQVREEFIKVECKFEGNNTVAYTNYHSFVHKKPEVESRCDSAARDKDLPSYSILIIGADAMSRLNMHRQFKRTYRYLKEEMASLEMFGFNKVGDNTLPNLAALLMGIKEEELPSVCWKSKKPFDDCPFLWKMFSKHGYRTLYAEDAPSISSFNYQKEGFYKQPTDYYFRPFMHTLEKDLGRDKRLNCYSCVGPISEVEAVLSWVGKFASTFPDRPYFAFAWTNSLTHDYLNWGSAGDVFYEEFFRTLHRRGDLNRTIVVFMGDHGLRWGAIRTTFIGRMEERLPMLLVSFPQDFRDRYASAVEAFAFNSHRLVTPFDLYATLQNILNFNGSSSLLYIPDEIPRRLIPKFTNRALTLFEPVPANRSCSDADIEEHWCTCQNSTPTSVNDTEVKHVAQFVVASLNEQLHSEQNACLTLVLRNVTNALIRAPHEHLRGKKDLDIFDYTVTITTEPNGAIYESTVRYVPKKHTHELLGEVSRLNLYGSQSHCVTERKLKKYCYCKDMLRVA